MAALGWASLAVLDLLVRVVLFFRAGRSPGATAILWGLGFALCIWAVANAVKLAQGRTIPFALVAGTIIALVVYFRGSATENPPEGQPGAYQRRLLRRWRAARVASVPQEPATGKTRELVEARLELERGDLTAALYSLRAADRVAVAQRKPEELLEIQELVAFLAARSRQPTTADASQRLARSVAQQLQTFPPEVLMAAEAGIESSRERRRALNPRATRRSAAEARGQPTTPELAEARAALEEGDLTTTLYALRTARRVAVAQRKRDELLEVRRLVRLLYQASRGRTREASARLAEKLEEDIRSFSPTLSSG